MVRDWSSGISGQWYVISGSQGLAVGNNWWLGIGHR